MKSLLSNAMAAVLFGVVPFLATTADAREPQRDRGLGGKDQNRGRSGESQRDRNQGRDRDDDRRGSASHSRGQSSSDRKGSESRAKEARNQQDRKRADEDRKRADSQRKAEADRRARDGRNQQARRQSDEIRRRAEAEQRARDARNQQARRSEDRKRAEAQERNRAAELIQARNRARQDAERRQRDSEARRRASRQERIIRSGRPDFNPVDLLGRNPSTWENQRRQREADARRQAERRRIEERERELRRARSREAEFRRQQEWERERWLRSQQAIWEDRRYRDEQPVMLWASNPSWKTWNGKQHRYNPKNGKWLPAPPAHSNSRHNRDRYVVVNNNLRRCDDDWDDDYNPYYASNDDRSFQWTSSWQDEYDRRQKMKNEWRNIAYLSGAVLAYGLIKGDDTAAIAGGAGALYSLYRYEEDRKSQSQMKKDRAEYYSRPYYYMNGDRYDRRLVTLSGNQYYQFVRL